MNRQSALRSLAPLAAVAFTLAACSGSGDEEPHGPKIRIALDAQDGSAPAAEVPMPGKIDPPDARWQVAPDASVARYGEPGQQPLLVLSCDDGEITAVRNAPSDKGAKAVLAFVGYRGILRLRVSNDGERWHGSLPADDPHWIAVTGGPFYATVAGGGKIITPGPRDATRVIERCAIPEAVPKPAPAMI
jgi:hypothetical protein